MTMQPISSHPVFCSGNSRNTFNNAGASGWEPLCRVHKWTLVYFIAQFSSIWKWNGALSGVLCLSILSNRNNERQIRMGFKVLQTRLSWHCYVPKGKVGWIKDVSRVTDSVLLSGSIRRAVSERDSVVVLPWPLWSPFQMKSKSYLQFTL